jgi:preprotein translocase subunit SecF
LLIGLATGAYSSIFIASPLLAVFKEREPRYRDVRRRMETRSTRAADPISADVVATDDGEPAGVGATVGGPTATGRVSTNIPPRPRKKGKRR